jgi:hypothetical protein
MIILCSNPEQNKEVELLFEDDDRITNDLMQKYDVIRKDFQRKRMPPLDSMFLGRFEKDYHFKLSEEEFENVKEYFLNSFTFETASILDLQIQQGFLKKIDYK